MILCKLIGYDTTTGNWTNPETGLIQNLPSMPLVVSDALPDNYEEYDSSENWARNGSNLIGSFSGVKDYLGLRFQIYSRIEIICGTDYANWDSLSEIQKQVAVVWCNIRVANAVGLPTYVQYCGGEEIALGYINDFLTKSVLARQQRYDAYSTFGFMFLGQQQGLQAENYARQYFLDSLYIKRGVAFISQDGINGLGDWILGLSIYSTTGLKPRIISGEFVLGGGIGIDDFTNKLIAIVNDGDY